jgi:hypothetical protein
MVKFLFLFVLTVLFILASIKIHVLLWKSKLLPFILWSIVYFLFIFFLFDPAVTLHNYLRDRGIYLEFGHTDEELVLFLFGFLVLAILNIMAVLVRIIIREKMTNTDET